MNGYDETSSVVSLARNILAQCEGEPEKIILEKAQLKMVLSTFVGQWSSDQERKRETFKKAKDAQ